MLGGNFLLVMNNLFPTGTGRLLRPGLIRS
jgi:hypothetical protein